MLNVYLCCILFWVERRWTLIFCNHGNFLVLKAVFLHLWLFLVFRERITINDVPYWSLFLKQSANSNQSVRAAYKQIPGMREELCSQVGAFGAGNKCILFSSNFCFPFFCLLEATVSCMHIHTSRRFSSLKLDMTPNVRVHFFCSLFFREQNFSDW